ncbi:ABC transporter substrate-binding protein [Sutcliffiella horikoshii]|uniref:ABC transporter substrate-binding protein n=1 Tax=Sutcliffiella horikoshii TaxID=79883 RepID=A0AA94WN84_9BACI|nr:zinc ABC transporter substrate-binding protein [Sutcliffiella horikoshii]TYS55704.1 ABC transporter substrate-binding protein [Sutcliffiella horikoshii]
MKTKSIFIAMMLVVFTFLVGCNSDNQASDGSEKLTVYTTIFPLEDFTKKIGGEHVDVKSVFPAGADAHTFEPSTKTMSEMASADAFIYTGVGVEGFADKAKGVLENEDVTIVAAGEGIELRGEEESHDEEAHEEEHDHEHDEEAHEEEHDHEHEEEAHEEEHDHEHEEEAHEEEHNHEHDEEAHEEEHDHEHEEGAHEEEHDHEHEEEAHEEEHHHEHEEEAHEEEHNHENEEEPGDEHGEDGHEGHDHSNGDPHVWLDPTLSITLAENVKNALVELKPEAKEDFEANFETLKADLEKLDTEFKDTVDSAKTNKILVSHAAYGYWENRYGLEQISVNGLSPTQEPSQKQLTEIINTAKENEIQYVIFDQNISGKIAEVVQDEIKAEALVLHNLEAATEKDVENEEDYFSLMRQNLETLKKALN